ncbi:alpha-1,4 glucan phosphorylase L-2 isozyme, chloroplastic/amyloplastic-like isoform X2 [Andrographis paniculata]|uniref:alpha-1,4 glucan phosphorylase L-2 isozyme, chloroplastic/amyloplastic-like isoform X2 n=1 Tax=Andrographis paniculata TaxID=175694 RepID=UPI0021E7D980|nr:alpha-1,4 glucan phosphorylase L-2 isozyme, chloroplastic/amyloplastic-like isoform X2 [Andrographis paniculata]
MEASSALRISHSSCSISSVALFAKSKGRSRHLKWRSASRKSMSSVRPRRCFVVTNVASEKQTRNLEDSAVLGEDEDEGLDALRPDSSSIVSSIKYHAEFSPSFSPERFELPKAYYATAESVRDMLIVNWNATYNYYEQLNVKQAYYLSMEFLQGRALLNAIGNLELTGAYAEALTKLGHNLEDVAKQEPDAALGNGGLGRLASCFLDSMATLNYPAWGYGLRYRYGLFKQLITKNGQEEVAENWLEMGNPWEIVRNDIFYPIKFYGEVIQGANGRKEWAGGESIIAVGYDVPIPGYKTQTTINLRLWSTKISSEGFNLQAFNAGEHTKAYEAMTRAEKICYILYPGDESYDGKTLRLKQQYTLCSASLQDIIARFEKRSEGAVNWDSFPDKVAVQMNDTHPTLCIPELLRILVDVKGLSWKEAWNITKRTVAYTNHTVLPEALEKWSLNLLQELLPRHVEIIRLIDEELINDIVDEYGTENLEMLKEKLKQMRILDNIELPSSVLESLIESQERLIKNSVEEEEEQEEEEEGKEGSESSKVAKPTAKEEIKNPKEDVKSKGKKADNSKKKEVKDPKKIVSSAFETDPKQAQLVRMANLCVAGGHAVNGVAEIHTDIVKREVFNEFYKLWPEKFQNKTNGVTPRRWIKFCNPELSRIITKWIGSEDWLTNTEKLVELRKFADNDELQSEWREAKMSNKKKIVSFIKDKTGYNVSPEAMFDVQIKRIHEYKRQLLNILGIVYRYKKMKEMSPEERQKKYVPRVCIFGGKAFATYIQAKRIVKFITDVGATINHDPDIGDLLKVVFVPDYNVSIAEVLIPGSELSQHISTAGMEASGTSNMKFAMNGCLLIGTLDGANVEIRQEVGEDNFFLFGARADEIAALREERAKGKFVPDPRFEEVKAYVRSGVFGPYNYNDLMGSLEGNEGYGRADYFLVGKDFPDYIECQDKVDEAYRNQKTWTRMSILNTAGSYKFSSDRTIHQYARDIWGIEAVTLP